MLVFIGILGCIGMAYGIIGIVNKKNPEFRLRAPRTILAIGFIVFIAIINFKIVNGQKVGVLFKPSGIDTVAVQSGWRFVPIWYDLFLMDKTVQVYTFSNKHNEGAKSEYDAIWAPTKDGIKMGFNLTVPWRIDPNYAPWIYANVSEQDGKDRFEWIEENIIRPMAVAALQMSANDFTPVELYGERRKDLQAAAWKKMQASFREYHILCDGISLREVFYNEAYEAMINKKKLEEQEKLRLEVVTQQKIELKKQADIDKSIAIVGAEGRARALQIEGQSVTNNPKIVALKWIERWNGQPPQTYVGGAGKEPMFILDLKDTK
jgi:regulator of protease activity HflC (stomatin/prohibitin superfamily)